MNNLRICEEFITLQGEGRFVGTPSYFIRTAGCNLRCIWGENKCDTSYAAWNIEKEYIYEFSEKNMKLSIKNRHIYHIVITGGEPLIQINGIISFLEKIKNDSFYITIETNGTIYTNRNILMSRDNRNKLLMSISPKLKSSYPNAVIYPNENKIHSKNNEKVVENLKMYLDNYPKEELQFKFVIDKEEDIDEVKWIQEITNIPNKIIWLMPQGIDNNTVENKSKWIFRKCLIDGYNFSPRLHISLFGNMRGI